MIGNVAVLELTVVVKGMLNCTAALPGVVSRADGTNTVTTVSLDVTGVKFWGLPPGAVNRTWVAKAPAPDPGKLPFRVRVVLPDPAEMVGGARLEMEGATTLNGRSCVLTGIENETPMLVTT